MQSRATSSSQQRLHRRVACTATALSISKWCHEQRARGQLARVPERASLYSRPGPRVPPSCRSFNPYPSANDNTTGKQRRVLGPAHKCGCLTALLSMAESHVWSTRRNKQVTAHTQPLPAARSRDKDTLQSNEAPVASDRQAGCSGFTVTPHQRDAAPSSWLTKSMVKNKPCKREAL